MYITKESFFFFRKKRKELDFVKIVVLHKDLLDEFNKFADSTFQGVLNLNKQIRFDKIRYTLPFFNQFNDNITYNLRYYNYNYSTFKRKMEKAYH